MFRDGVTQQYLSIADLKDLGLLKHSKKIDNIKFMCYILLITKVKN